MKLTVLALVFCFGLTAPGEVYVTLEHVSIDRCASAWFIKRFVDSEATYAFFAQGAKPPPGIGFGFYGAQYFNHGPDCTFTDLVKKNKKGSNPALQKMNTVVNDVMSWMQGPGSMSARLNNHIAEVYELTKSDGAVFENVFPTFDLLYFKCEGLEEAYLDQEKKCFDLLELRLFSRLLDAQGKHRLERFFGTNTPTSYRPSEILNSLGFAPRSEKSAEPMNTSPVQDLVKALSNQDLGIGEEALKWVQDVLNRGIQTNRMSELFAPSNHTPTAGIDGNTFLFERTLWLRAVDKSTGAPR